MWQNAATGAVSGIAGDVDLDVCYVDYPKNMINAGLNGYDTPSKKVVNITAMIDGITYSGELSEI